MAGEACSGEARRGKVSNGMAGKVRLVAVSPGMVTQVVVWQAIKGGILWSTNGKMRHG